jgi:hypothetical protein
VKLSLYMDDGRIVAKTREAAVQQLRFVLHVLQLCGWNVQWGKTRFAASQQLLHLGFETDTVQLKYFYPEEKVASYETLLNLFIEWSMPVLPTGRYFSLKTQVAP